MDSGVRRLELDNNRAERPIKPCVIERKHKPYNALTPEEWDLGGYG